MAFEPKQNSKRHVFALIECLPPEPPAPGQIANHFEKVGASDEVVQDSFHLAIFERKSIPRGFFKYFHKTTSNGRKDIRKGVAKMGLCHHWPLSLPRPEHEPEIQLASGSPVHANAAFGRCSFS